MRDIHGLDQINEAALRLQAIIETAIDGIITISERGIIDHINPAAAALFGYDPQEVVGQNVKMLMPSPYHEEHDGYLQRYHKPERRLSSVSAGKLKGLEKMAVFFQSDWP